MRGGGNGWELTRQTQFADNDLAVGLGRKHEVVREPGQLGELLGRGRHVQKMLKHTSEEYPNRRVTVSMATTAHW